MKNKLSLLLALTLCMTMLLAACTTTPTTSPAASPATTTDGTSLPENTIAEPQKLTYGVVAEAQSLDPGNCNETYAIPVLMNCFMGLVKLDGKGVIQPGLATSWTVSEDQLVYTFNLVESKFSDGTPLTAEDFVYSWKRALDPALANVNASMLFAIVGGQDYFEGKGTADAIGVKALDANTLEVTLINPLPYFLDQLATWTFFPVKQAVVEGNDQWFRDPATYISNGPFKVKSIEFGKQIVLEKNENYYNAANVKLDEITLRVISDMTTGLTAVENGEIDGYDSVPDAEVPRLKTDSTAFNSVTMLSTSYYIVNKTKAPFDDPKVVRALALAIDRDSIIKDVLQNVYQPAFGLIPPGMNVGGKDFRQTAGDYGFTAKAQIEEAKALLAEAGYPNGEGFPEFRLRYYSNDSVKKIVEALQQMWKQNLNINCVISNADWQVYYDEVINKDYDIGAMGGTADVAHPTTFLNSFMMNGADYKTTGWHSDAYDAKMTASMAAATPEESLALMVEAEKMLMDDMPIIPVYHKSKNFMMQPYVKDWTCDSLNIMRFEYAYIEGRTAAK